ncbi:putative cysteine-rich receptor-like protein kinase 33 [Durio zibethinus]|uniref:non-specific serine/threonine protein kinase n=1 Tax=Durio zibethinus TaxID=66656 RepID=A0A6P5XKN1_DURZI|nr:putative cysteine-rich receptor-like protein kinase 33 [Durio zibethinus]
MEGQRVMVIQDASKEVCSSAIRWVLHGLCLKPGDQIVLLGVLHEVIDPRTLSFKGTRKLLGYRNKVDFTEKFGANHRIVDRKEARKQEYENNAEIMEISKLCKAEKVEFRIEVAAGASPAVVAMKSAENLKATWVILDRKMKKNKKIFQERLSCGISRMKRNNSIKLLREPRTKFDVTYDIMMQGPPEEEDLFSIELFPTCKINCGKFYFYVKQKVIKIQNIEWRKDYTYLELHAATDGFSSKNNISEGGVEYTFRGQLENKLNIVIKPANNNIYFQEPMKFKSEIDILSRVRHKNLVMLLGCCAEGSHRLLVYEYVCNGSLNQHLSKCQPMPLSWTKRVKVALGASRGLNHLHQNNIIHKDIRSSNILLNYDFEPLVMT